MQSIVCDGCGQPADQEHIARRLKRLENMTRYRPIHVQMLFLAAARPADDREYLYSANDALQGEGALVASAVGFGQPDKGVEEMLTAFQRSGYLLTYVLDCPVESSAARLEALARQMPATLTRIRRSFKPKRVVLLGQELAEFVPQFMSGNLNAAVILRNGRPFEWNEIGGGWLAKELAAPMQAL
jgi:hypothetical protein